MALKSGRVGIHPSQVDPITGMLIAGPGGTTDYTQLTNKPQINNVTLTGNKSLSDLGIATSFDTLTDSAINNPEVGQTLIYNGTGWENEFSSISPTTLSALQDVQITDVEDGDYLVYDATNNKWINSASAPTPVTPEGSTVLPTDDIQTWLACAAITDKTYTTLNEVLADSTTLLALMSDNNAVDYLVRSTTWASGITANSTAMTDIGANNYCANTLLSDSTWCSAICNSTYFESVLNVKVPTMTSNTTPSGTVIFSSEHTSSSYKAYKAFDNDNTTAWYAGNASSSNEYIGYDFDNEVTVYRVKVVPEYDAGTIRLKNIKIEYSDDNSTWNGGNDNSFLVPDVDQSNDFVLVSTGSYRYWRMFVVDDYGNTIACETLQFYGR